MDVEVIAMSHNSGRSRGYKSGAMTPKDASRIQSKSAKDPSSRSAKTDFGPRAQSAGDRNRNTKGHDSP